MHFVDIKKYFPFPAPWDYGMWFKEQNNVLITHVLCIYSMSYFAGISMGFCQTTFHGGLSILFGWDFVF